MSIPFTDFLNRSVALTTSRQSGGPESSSTKMPAISKPVPIAAPYSLRNARNSGGNRNDNRLSAARIISSGAGPATVALPITSWNSVDLIALHYLPSWHQAPPFPARHSPFASPLVNPLFPATQVAVFSATQTPSNLLCCQLNKRSQRDNSPRLLFDNLTSTTI